MEQTKKSSQITARQIIDHIREGIMITDASGIIQSINPTFAQVTGYTPTEIIGKSPSVLKSGKHSKNFYKRLWKTLTETGVWQGEITNKKKDGTFYTEWLTITGLKNKKGEVVNYIGVFNDITKRKHAEEVIRHMAYYDPLTDLPNRVLFKDRLKHDIAHSLRQNKLLSVLFLDLDQMKIINDTLGHATGDKVLKGVSKRLKAALREEDTVARMGGDEFMIIIPNMDQVETIAKIADKILNALKPPFYFEKHELYITASIGLSVFPFDGQDVNTLIKHADTAMYRAKQLGRNNFQIFTPTMKQEVFEQLTMKNNLRRALDRGEFVLHYQPQMDMATGDIIGMEALVRWMHPTLGLIPPGRFIRWAEDSGLIVPLGEWVLKESCQQNKTWQEMGYSKLRVSVNLSARQFNQENLVTIVENALKETSLHPSSLDLELTETVLMENPKTAIEISHELRARGIRFSIDDFGTGYSSLSYLKRLPVDSLKIDQSFVQDLASDPSDKAIAKAVIALGHGLDLTVIAEGVETEKQRDVLKGYQCDFMQGFLISEPLPSEDFGALLKENKPFFNEQTLFQAN